MTEKKTTGIRTFGSVCSGIEAASFTLEPMGVRPLWLSEIAEYPVRFLAERYAHVPNLGDMCHIPERLRSGEIVAPDLLVGGTPCQAFSLAGWRGGVDDERGQLTLKYIDIIDAIDERRQADGLTPAAFFWENVEGALTDKTNAFGCFLAGLAGLEAPIVVAKFPSAGVLYGPRRNIAWRVLDAKYFGVPQQRRRVYVLGGGTDFHPEDVLFEAGPPLEDPYKVALAAPATSGGQLFDDDGAVSDQASVVTELTRTVDGHAIEIFRSYTDCLYAAYGTKWNGNAAAFNGSLYVAQDGRLRRLTPIECERLMGFPAGYTSVGRPRLTHRYQATGNSWAVPVVRWIMERLLAPPPSLALHRTRRAGGEGSGYALHLFQPFQNLHDGLRLNCSAYSYDYRLTSLLDIIDPHPDECLYISKAGCAGILRRKYEHNAGMNARLEAVLKTNST